jgi:hypothetical protein
MRQGEYQKVRPNFLKGTETKSLEEAGRSNEGVVRLRQTRYSASVSSGTGSAADTASIIGGRCGIGTSCFNHRLG